MNFRFRTKGEIPVKKFDKRCIESYNVVGISSPPQTQFIPVNRQRREALIEEFKLRHDVELPNYDLIVRDHLHPCDLRVLCVEYSESYEYRGGLFRDTYYPGYITDGASIPTGLVIGSLTKEGQQIQEPAQAHDKDFADKLFSFKDCNRLFRARIEQQETWGNKRAGRTKRRYSFGVGSFIGKRIFKKGKPHTNWMRGFYKHEILREMEW